MTAGTLEICGEGGLQEWFKVYSINNGSLKTLPDIKTQGSETRGNSRGRSIRVKRSYYPERKNNQRNCTTSRVIREEKKLGQSAAKAR